MPVAQLRLLVFGAVVLGLEIVATIVAIALNLPAQFGDVGTDAGSEFAARGTAISPPIAPLIILAGSLLLLRRRDRWATVGCVVIGLLGVLFAIGSIGEAAANATPDVSKAVLVGSGVVGSLIGATLVFLAVAAVMTARSAEFNSMKSPRATLAREPRNLASSAPCTAAVRTGPVAGNASAALPLRTTRGSGATLTRALECAVAVAQSGIVRCA